MKLLCKPLEMVQQHSKLTGGYYFENCSHDLRYKLWDFVEFEEKELKNCEQDWTKQNCLMGDDKEKTALFGEYM